MAVLEPRTPTSRGIVADREVAVAMHGLDEVPVAIRAIFETPTLPRFPGVLRHHRMNVARDFEGGVEDQPIGHGHDQHLVLSARRLQSPELMPLPMRRPHGDVTSGLSADGG